MRYVFISLAAAVVGLAVWVFVTHSMSLWIDRVYRVPVESWAPDHFRYSLGDLNFGRGEVGREELGPEEVRLWMLGPKSEPSTASWKFSGSGRMLLVDAGVDAGKSFPVGPARADYSRPGQPKFAFAPDVGDTVRFDVERSLLSWPTPFETNFMTGVVPHWKRTTYSRLRWTKRSGARLEMRWQGEQLWYTEGGWRPPEVKHSTIGLVEVRITEAADLEKAAVQYLAGTKHWERPEYELEFRGPTGEGREEIVFALHRDDSRAGAPGAGKSVELRLGYESRKVTREIGGQ